MKKFDQINVIPFIDIMLVLLAIVLLTASFSHNGKIDVSLPAVDNADPVESEILPQVITADTAGKLYLDDRETTLENIGDGMAQWDKNQPVLLKIDKNAPFERFVQLSDLLKKHELKNISVLTEESSPRP